MKIGVNVFGLKKVLKNDDCFFALKQAGIFSVELCSIIGNELPDVSNYSDNVKDKIRVIRNAFLTFDENEERIERIKANGLEVKGAHIGVLSKPFENPLFVAEQLICFGRNNGLNYFVIGVEGTVDGAQTIIPNINLIAQKLKRAGMELVYHNHHIECVAESDGRSILGCIMESCRDLRYQFDVGWLHYAGIDVLEFLNRYKNVIHSIHLKNFLIENGKPVFVSLGSGCVPIEKALLFAKENSTCDTLIIDQDDSEDILSDVVKGYKFIKNFLEKERR